MSLQGLGYFFFGMAGDQMLLPELRRGYRGVGIDAFALQMSFTQNHTATSAAIYQKNLVRHVCSTAQSKHLEMSRFFVCYTCGKLKAIGYKPQPEYTFRRKLKSCCQVLKTKNRLRIIRGTTHQCKLFLWKKCTAHICFKNFCFTIHTGKDTIAQ